jgi:hypothetical protein
LIGRRWRFYSINECTGAGRGPFLPTSQVAKRFCGTRQKESSTMMMLLVTAASG